MTALLEKGVDVISLVALGGATKVDITYLDLFFDALILTIGWLSEELFQWIGRQWSSENNFLTSFTEKIGAVFNEVPLIGSLDDVIGGALQILGDAAAISLKTIKTVIDWVLGFISAGLEALPLDSIIGVPDVPADSDTFLVNVYGEDDVLAKMGLSGKLDAYQGLSADRIFNIEIQSTTTTVTPNVLYPDGIMTLEADHYNYIRKDEEAVIHAQTAQEFISPEEEAKIREHHPQNADQIIAEIKAARMDWNLRVSDFVAELIAVNKDGQEAVELLLHSDSRVDFNAVDNIFEVNVL